MSEIYSYSATALDQRPLSLEAFRGKVLLIVNTASQCGLTPQYEGLQRLHEAYHGRGLEVLGFPCNQFGKQEPGGSDEIGRFCELNYGVGFTLFDKVEVNGEGAHPLFRFLKREAPGVLGTERIKWNFTKFLVDRTGRVVARFAPATRPDALRKHIERLL